MLVNIEPDIGKTDELASGQGQGQSRPGQGKADQGRARQSRAGQSRADVERHIHLQCTQRHTSRYRSHVVPMHGTRSKVQHGTGYAHKPQVATRQSIRPCCLLDGIV